MKFKPVRPQGDAFAAVKDAALQQIESLCKRLLPHGRVQGQWYNARVPWRDDSKPSLGVSLTTGRYVDWANAGDGGSIIDLVMKLDGCDAKTAVATLASMLGIGDVKEFARNTPKRPEPPSCLKCTHRWARYPWADYCVAVVDFMDQEPTPTERARRSGRECGTQGKLFRAVAS